MSSRPGHSPKQIARAAIEIADAEGFDAVSMRRVAQELGAGTMTLYHYVANKDELITLMFDEVMAEVLVPGSELSAEWRTAITRIAINTREAFRRHRWALDRLGEGRPGPNGLRHFEQTLQAVSVLEGISDNEKFELISQVDDYIYGFALREAQELGERERGWAPGVEEFLQRELSSGDYPLISSFMGTDVKAADNLITEIVFKEGRFERGLERLLDGIEAGLEKR